MIRLLKIELLKLRPARYFWIFLGLYVLILIGIPIGAMALGNWITDELMPADSPIKSILPFYDFADIWQNFAYLYHLYFFAILPMSLVVINVAQEFSLQTARQNIIDGMSRGEFFLGKFLFIFTLAAVITVVVFLICLIFGLLYSPVQDVGVMFANVEFIGAYFIQLVHAFLFAMLIGLVVRRTGIGVVVMFFYGLIEMFVEALIRYAADLPKLADLLPSAATKVLIHAPFPKYALEKTITTIQGSDLIVSLGWIAVLIVVNRWIIIRRDF